MKKTVKSKFKRNFNLMVISMVIMSCFIVFQMVVTYYQHVRINKLTDVAHENHIMIEKTQKKNYIKKP
jgi:hypothetical protein